MFAVCNLQSVNVRHRYLSKIKQALIIIYRYVGYSLIMINSLAYNPGHKGWDSSWQMISQAVSYLSYLILSYLKDQDPRSLPAHFPPVNVNKNLKNKQTLD